jgi:cobalt-zinc-cadmium efflux system protein
MAHSHSHGHAHDHRPPAAAGPARDAHRRALRLALALTATYTVVEIAGGLLTGSLALLADAAHMLSDNLSLALALFAISLAGRPPTPQRSFGYQRAEILAALANGVALLAVSAWILYEAIGRLSDPGDVLGGAMLAVAFVGLLVNVAAFRILQSGASENLNVAGAMRHVLADLAGSVGVIAAALVILLTGWQQADPLIGGLIAVLVAASAVPIVRGSMRVLLEQAPEGVDANEIGRAMAAAPGIDEVHDLHVWEITSGFVALSAHVLVPPGQDCHARRRELEALLGERFGIEHTTLQVDHSPGPDLLQIEGVGGGPGGASSHPA